MHTCQFLLQDVAFSLLFWSSPEIGGFASQRTSNSPLNVCNTHRRCLVPSQWSALKPFGNKSDKAGTMDSCLSSFGKVLCLAVKGLHGSLSNHPVIVAASQLVIVSRDGS